MRLTLCQQVAKGHAPEPEVDLLSKILEEFNELFGNIAWKDKGKIRKLITIEIPEKIRENQAYKHAMKNSDKENAKIEHDKALKELIMSLFSDHAELFKQFSDNEDFRKWLTKKVFSLTYNKENAA